MKNDKALPAVEVSQLKYIAGETEILHEIDLIVEKGSWVGLIGPNGCGKSTLLKNIYRHYRPTKGTILIDGANVFGLKNKEAARKMAILAQENSMEFDFTVRDIVAMGRYAHRSFLESESEEDERICEDALKTVGLETFAERSFLSLSGGEKQRVYVAMAFAQLSELIIMDEPTNHLDIGYQFLLMDTLEKRRREKNLTVFTSIHDMDLAAAYCDNIILMDKGRIVAFGTPEEVLRAELIRSIFHIDAEIAKDEATGKLRVRYIRYHH